MIVNVNDCSNCPYLRKDQDMNATITSCGAPHAPEGYGSVLETKRDGSVYWPTWCPIKKETVIIRWGGFNGPRRV